MRRRGDGLRRGGEAEGAGAVDGVIADDVVSGNRPSDCQGTESEKQTDKEANPVVSEGALRASAARVWPAPTVTFTAHTAASLAVNLAAISLGSDLSQPSEQAISK